MESQISAFVAEVTTNLDIGALVARARAVASLLGDEEMSTRWGYELDGYPADASVEVPKYREVVSELIGIDRIGRGFPIQLPHELDEAINQIRTIKLISPISDPQEFSQSSDMKGHRREGLTNVIRQVIGAFGIDTSDLNTVVLRVPTELYRGVLRRVRSRVQEWAYSLPLRGEAQPDNSSPGIVITNAWGLQVHSPGAVQTIQFDHGAEFDQDWRRFRDSLLKHMNPDSLGTIIGALAAVGQENHSGQDSTEIAASVEKTWLERTGTAFRDFLRSLPGDVSRIALGGLTAKSAWKLLTE